MVLFCFSLRVKDSKPSNFAKISVCYYEYHYSLVKVICYPKAAKSFKAGSNHASLYSATFLNCFKYALPHLWTERASFGVRRRLAPLASVFRVLVASVAAISWFDRAIVRDLLFFLELPELIGSFLG